MKPWSFSHFFVIFVCFVILVAREDPGRSSESALRPEVVRGALFLGPKVSDDSKAGEADSSVRYSPPSPESAPRHLRESVMLGYHIMMDTRKYAPQYVGNELKCKHCHFKGGMTRGGENGALSLVGTAAEYPKYRKRAKGVDDLLKRTNSCFERSMNGKPLPLHSKEMVGLMSYYHWISKGLPIYERVPWLGLKKLKSDHTPQAGGGQKVYEVRCAICHGNEGQGIEGPPLWGSGSFNDGAGMAKLASFAAFTYLNMPHKNPILSVDEALDAAAYVIGQPRPHFSPPEADDSDSGE